MLAIVKAKKELFPLIWERKSFLPPYVLRIFRQFGFTDDEIERLLS
jgi:hypothetical protein